MRKFIISFICLFISFQATNVACQSQGEYIVNNYDQKSGARVIFATFAQTDEQVKHIYYLAESIREFGGAFKDAPIRLYIADYSELNIDEIVESLESLGVEVYPANAPEEALWFYYAGKVFAAGAAERDAAGDADVLVWMDDDTIFLDEPSELLLGPQINFAYRPVMHNRSGSLYDQTPDAFWGRIYEVLNVNNDDLFAMTTPADNQEIRAYFNAGLLAVRPQNGILQKWGDDFTKLYQDTVLANMCRVDVEKRIFLHQTALVGAVLNSIEPNEMVELSDQYNYPLFFEQMFGAIHEFGSIEDIITLRYDIYFRNPDPEWDKKIKGPSDKIAWLTQRLSK
jgi:hypothetical protein